MNFDTKHIQLVMGSIYSDVMFYCILNVWFILNTFLVTSIPNKVTQFMQLTGPVTCCVPPLCLFWSVLSQHVLFTGRYGVLAVTRSFGDRDFKCTKDEGHGDDETDTFPISCVCSCAKRCRSYCFL